MAYTIACLGVTENDWETLGKQALETLDLEVARKAYTRLKDLRHLELITDLEQRKNRDEDQVLVADIAAFQVQTLQYKYQISRGSSLIRPERQLKPSFWKLPFFKKWLIETEKLPFPCSGIHKLDIYNHHLWPADNIERT